MGADAEALPVPMRPLWNADTCPLSLLPWLAWAWRVEEWDETWSEFQKRQAVKDALMIHRRKGTLWAIKRVLANHGFGGAHVQENPVLGSHHRIQRNGTVRRDGLYLRGWQLGAFTWRVVISNLSFKSAKRNGTAKRTGMIQRGWIQDADFILTPEKKKSLWRALVDVAPARSLLIGVFYFRLPSKRNGTIKRNGQYNRGETFL